MSSLVRKIVLGTVQLGMPYGINNSYGKPSKHEAFKILDTAFSNGIILLDSADVYGESLQIIGDYHRATGNKFELVNKFKLDNCYQSLTDKLQNCLDVTGLSQLYSYMYHSYDDYISGKVSTELDRIKELGLIKKIGVSLYSLEELKVVAGDSKINLIQLPANIFDLNQEKVDLLIKAKANGKEIHVRSVFFQGMFFRDPETLTGNIKRLKPYLLALRELVSRQGVDLKKMALNHILQKEYIDSVVLGVDNSLHLQENLSPMEFRSDCEDLATIKIKPEDIYLLNPANWRP